MARVPEGRPGGRLIGRGAAGGPGAVVARHRAVAGDGEEGEGRGRPGRVVGGGREDAPADVGQQGATDDVGLDVEGRGAVERRDPHLHVGVDERRADDLLRAADPAPQQVDGGPVGHGRDQGGEVADLPQAAGGHREPAQDLLGEVVLDRRRQARPGTGPADGGAALGRCQEQRCGLGNRRGFGHRFHHHLVGTGSS